MILVNTAVDILIILFLALGAYAGWRKGLIKSLVSIIGLIAIIIISYALKTNLANFLIDKFPFFNFPGMAGLTSINVLIYNIISFVVIFVLLYCILNIVLAITGFVDTLLKFTVIWIIPSKIGGAIVNFVEAWLFVYLVLFVLGSFGISSGFIVDSKVSNFILDHTPVVGTMLKDARTTIKEVAEEFVTYSKDEEKTTDDLNLRILQIEILNGLITKEKAQELIDTGKVDLDNVYFGKGDSLWSNI